MFEFDMPFLLDEGDGNGTPPPTPADEPNAPATLEEALDALKARDNDAKVARAKLEQSVKQEKSLRERLAKLEDSEKERAAAVEARKPLEERLAASEKRQAELEQAMRDAELRAMRADLRAEALALGVTNDRLDDAITLYEAARARLEEGQDAPTLDAFVKTRPFLLSQTDVEQGGKKPPVKPANSGGTGGKQQPVSILDALAQEGRK
jgi:hypothetical protein